MSLLRFIAAVLIAVSVGLVLTCLAGFLTYGIGRQIGYEVGDSVRHDATGAILASATITLAACGLAGGLWAAKERTEQARVFLPRDVVVVVAVAVPLFVLWAPVAAVVGLATAVALYGLGLVVGCRRA